ncbi:MAG: hypothetical protein ACRD4B_04805, partial [Acidobacteriota bacterium]
DRGMYEALAQSTLLPLARSTRSSHPADRPSQMSDRADQSLIFDHLAQGIATTREVDPRKVKRAQTR